jgi:phosphohistidine phosphatase
MKTVVLVRHAKSDWSDPSLTDFERPLNERGKRDAPIMAQRLIGRKVKIDVFITSPARRAKKTASIFAAAYKAGKKKIIQLDKLYAAPEEVFFDVIKEADDQYKSMAIFAHNPGITDFANLLTTARIDNIPTCGIFTLTADCKKWTEFQQAAKEFQFFDYPKAIDKVD